MQKYILDLGAGLGGEERREKVEAMGFVYHTLDINPDFGCTFTADVFGWEPRIKYDFVWGSPPCTKFTVMSIGKHWNKDNTPKTKEAAEAVLLVERFIEICKTADRWIIENPRAKLRKLPAMRPYRRWTVTYCQYGENRMKPTDLWGVLPGWTPRPHCNNGDDCHISAPRGSRTGTQGMTSAESAVVPWQLWEEILRSLERPCRWTAPTYQYQMFTD